MGDALAKRVKRVRPQAMTELLDMDAFCPRVEAVATAAGSSEVKEFLEASQRADRGERD